MITPGDRLDLGFKIQTLHRGVSKTMEFNVLLKRKTIVSVYMRNNTPGCDRQNESLAAHAAKFNRAGYDLIGVSRDTGGSHVKYAANKGIGYTLVSDPEYRFARAADSLVEKSMYGKTFIGPVRAAYVLERDGTVLAVVEKVDTADHAAQLFDVIKKL